MAALPPRAPPRAPTRRDPARYLAEGGGCLHAPRGAGVRSPTGSRRGPPAGRARGPHRCLAASPATTEPVRDRERPRRRRPPPAPSDQEMGRHRKSRMPSGAPPPRLRRLQGPAPPPRVIPSRSAPLRAGMSRPRTSRPAAPGAPPAPRCGGRGSGGSAGWRRRARHAGGGSSPWPADGGPCGGGDYKSRHTAQLRPAGRREGPVAEPRAGVAPQSGGGAEAAPGPADGARGLCVLLAARDERRNRVREELQPTFGLGMVTGFNLRGTRLAVLWGSVVN
ncbi:translation initiation factor IF-2-like [Motacilla alba alba]|uniref:translation initiation factor IF-2-like n=1 Tax=Motacilla alba alba TaxID=1094192 RepID=UPI0018D532C0|nr:translation initiation factor IF-2-like [Motacilla alba alba]